MDSPEQAAGTLEIIHLNQEFTLLDPRRTNYRAEISSLTSTEITLAAEVLPNFTLNISVLGGMQGRYSKGFVLTPFNPEIGSSIVSADLDAGTRLKKLLENKIELNKKVTSPLASHMMVIQTGRSAAEILGSNHLQGKSAFNPEYIEHIEKLRILLSFPTGSYLARPVPEFLIDGKVIFNFYYPVETGPLPVPMPVPKTRPKGLEFFVAEGFPLLVPFNKSQLETIKGRFLVSK